MPVEFVHLHNHTEYSMLDGMLRILDLKGKKPSDFLKSLGEQKVPAMAITDHGNMYGAMEFYFNCQKVGVKPIIGCEVYQAPGGRDRHDKTTKPGENRHLTVLAKDNQGYRNLMHLVSDAFIEGTHYKPRIDFSTLEKYHEGLICLSGCLAGEISQLCLAGKIDEAVQYAGRYSEILGKGNFYIEIMDHNIPEEATARTGLLEVARRTGLPLVATNDCHYWKEADWELQDVSICIGTKRTLNDPERLTALKELYFKTPEQMAALFKDVPEAIKNTMVIAEQCNVSVETGRLHLPEFPIPEKYHTPECGDEGDYYYLRDLCEEGLKKKIPNADKKYHDRLDFELEVIRKMGFSSYFLIVRDFIAHARSKGISVGPGRGSGAGALVAYTLDITRVDPLPFSLLFERFLNPGRKSMPDLDIDFDEERREEVIDYVRQKYGQDHVARIITYGTMAAKNAIKDVGRAMDIPLNEINAITKLIPDKAHLYETIAPIDPNKKDNTGVPELIEKTRDPKIKKLFEYAMGLEGLPRQEGIHACGVIVSPEEILNYAPLSNRNNKHSVTTQYDGPMLGDTLGLLKVDFLGLRTLNVIEMACDFIRKNGKPDFDIYDIPLDDKKTFDMMSEGKTVGVFQLESAGMRNLVRRLRPNVFSDISALVALFRPGPLQSGFTDQFVECKNGAQVKYDHPLMEPVLKDTYGTMVYQEQVMEISKRMADFTPSEADDLRKAMGKKKLDVMEKMKGKFIEQANKFHDVPKDLSASIFDKMAAFAGYGFNKSHSVAYALVSYQTAWLRANYPTEFFAGLMSSEIGHSPMGSEDKENKIVTYIGECQDLGIEVRGPDINKSAAKFTIEREQDKDGQEKASIRISLAAIRNVGEGVVEEIVAEREKNGPYKSFEEFTMRSDSKQLNKRCLEALAKAGAFDSLYEGKTVSARRGKAVQAMLDYCEGSSKKGFDPNQAMLFGMEEAQEQESNYTESMMLKDEYDFLGMYLSGHPLNSYRRHMGMLTDVNVSAVVEGEYKEKSNVRIAGMITQLKMLKTKKGDSMAKFVLEDLTGSISVCLFPKKYQMFGHELANNKLIVMTGRVQISDFGDKEHYELQAEEIYELFAGMNRWAKSLVINLSPALLSDKEKLASVKKVIDNESGLCPVCLVADAGGSRYFMETDSRVAITDMLLKQLANNVGGNSWKVDMN